MKKKLTAVALIVCMLAIMLVGASLAYFTDETQTAENTFTVGNVSIELYEGEPSDKIYDGIDFEEAIIPGRDFDKNPTIEVGKNSQDCYAFLEMDLNKYVSLINLMGVEYYGPEYQGFTAFVTELAANKTLRADVVNKWFTGITHEDWQIMNLEEIETLVASVAKGQNPSHLKIVLGYIGGADEGVLAAEESVTFMTGFGMPEEVTQSMMDGEDAYYIDGTSKSNFNTDSAKFKMAFTAYAIQADEVDSIEKAYEYLFATK